VPDDKSNHGRSCDRRIRFRGRPRPEHDERAWRFSRQASERAVRPFISCAIGSSVNAPLRFDVSKRGRTERSFRGAVGPAWRSAGPTRSLERQALNRDRGAALSLCLSIGFIRKPLRTFRSDALIAARWQIFTWNYGWNRRLPRYCRSGSKRHRVEAEEARRRRRGLVELI
jgi:hypothetical protein